MKPIDQTDHTDDPGSMVRWMIGRRRVAASRLATICTYPNANKCLDVGSMSAIPKTQISLAVAIPRRNHGDALVYDASAIHLFVQFYPAHQDELVVVSVLRNKPLLAIGKWQLLMAR